MTAQYVYAASVEPLPPSEQLRLATLILEGLAPAAVALDFRDEWSAEDMHDITAYSALHAASDADVE